LALLTASLRAQPAAQHSVSHCAAVNCSSSINIKSKIYRNNWFPRNKVSTPSTPCYLAASQLSRRTSSSAQPQQKRGSTPGQDKTVLSSPASPDRLCCREWSWPLIHPSIQVYEWVELYLHSICLDGVDLGYHYCIRLYIAQACTGVADTFTTAVFIKNYKANLFKRHLTTLSTAEII